MQSFPNKQSHAVKQTSGWSQDSNSNRFALDIRTPFLL